VSSIKKDGFVNEKYKSPIFIGINGIISNGSRGLGTLNDSTALWNDSGLETALSACCPV